MRTHLIYVAISLTTVVVLYTSFTLLKTGTTPSIAIITQYQKLFLAGFMMIPLPSFPHTWNIVFLIYLSGLIYSIKGLFEVREDTVRDSIIFMLSILGIGLFVYYVGRSHDMTLKGPAYVAILILTIFADILIDQFRKNGFWVSGGTCVAILILYFLFSAPVSILYNAKDLLEKVQFGFFSLTDNGNQQHSNNVQFIKKHTYVGEKILILATGFDGPYYGESGTVCAVNLPSSSDYFFRTEIAELISYLKTNKSGKVFVYPAEYDFPDTEINYVLKNYYEIIERSNDKMTLLQKIQ